MPQKLHAESQAAASQAAQQAGVVVTELKTAEQCRAAADLLNVIWNGDGQGNAPMEPGLLIALEHAGNYISGAYLGGELVGVTSGFFGTPSAAMMHSHIAGVSAAAKGKGVGAAMKLHQRAWCLQRGITTLEWTFDPLILRNAGFNINRLGARLEEYLPHFYGQMRDGINAGQGSDRALVRWHLGWPADASLQPATKEASATVRYLDVGKDGAPVLRAEDAGAYAKPGDVIGLRIPLDIETMRAQHPDLAARWRGALRETMYSLLETGWAVRGILRDGTYLLHR